MTASAPVVPRMAARLARDQPSVRRIVAAVMADAPITAIGSGGTPWRISGRMILRITAIVEPERDERPRATPAADDDHGDREQREQHLERLDAPRVRAPPRTARSSRHLGDRHDDLVAGRVVRHHLGPAWTLEVCVEHLARAVALEEQYVALSSTSTRCVLLLEGARAGEVLDAYLEGPGGSQVVANYAPGDEVVVAITKAGRRRPYVAVADRWRVETLQVLLALFAIAVVVVGGWRGVRALVALGLTIAVILKIILPLILQGVPPLPMAVIGASAITAATILLTEGWSRASLAAILGTTGALSVTGLLAAATAAAGFTYSAGSDLAFLQTQGGRGLDLRGILLAAIILGAVGVLDDVTVTQAVVVDELADRGALRGRLLFSSALDIGRSHIGCDGQHAVPRVCRRKPALPGASCSSPRHHPRSSTTTRRSRPRSCARSPAASGSSPRCRLTTLPSPRCSWDRP